GGLAPERVYGGRVVRGAARAGRGQGRRGGGGGGGVDACGGGASAIGSDAGRPTLGAEPVGAAAARRAGAARGVGGLLADDHRAGDRVRERGEPAAGAGHGAAAG